MEEPEVEEVQTGGWAIVSRPNFLHIPIAPRPRACTLVHAVAFEIPTVLPYHLQRNSQPCVN